MTQDRAKEYFDLAEKGLGGSIYTQTSDVELEVNGLMTYDRRVLKFDPAKLRAVHAEIIRRATGPCGCFAVRASRSPYLIASRQAYSRAALLKPGAVAPG